MLRDRKRETASRAAASAARCTAASKSLQAALHVAAEESQLYDARCTAGPTFYAFYQFYRSRDANAPKDPFF